MEDARADKVARDEVGRELDPLERPAQDRRSRLDRQRLRQAGYALDQEVTLREQADEHPLEHLVLPGDHPPDLEERTLQPLADLCRLDLARFHVASLGCLPPKFAGSPKFWMRRPAGLHPSAGVGGRESCAPSGS